MPATTDSRVFEELTERYPNAKRILAEGDSWFAYPRRYLLFGAAANVIDHLAKRPDLMIYNTASNGDEAVTMLSGEQKLQLIKRINHHHFDHLLFSGGGNDIVGRYDLGFFLRPHRAGMHWQDCIIERRLAMKLEHLKISYQILCELAQEHSQNTDIKIITHTYDLAPPSETGFELFDLIPLGSSWMQPYLLAKNIQSREDQAAIVGYLLGAFRQMLLNLGETERRLTVVDTQGLLQPEEWLNEIHPTSEGFGKIANAIMTALE